MAVGRAYAHLFCATKRKKIAASTLFTDSSYSRPAESEVTPRGTRTSDSHCAPRGHSARVAFSRDHAGTLGSVSETVAWMSCGTKRPGAHSIHRLSSRSALATISRLVTCLCRHACHRLCAADRNTVLDTVMSGQVYGSLLVAGCGVQGSICLLTHITMATSRTSAISPASTSQRKEPVFLSSGGMHSLLLRRGMQ